MRRISKAEMEQYLKERKDAAGEARAFLEVLSNLECEEGDFIAQWSKEAAQKALRYGTTRPLQDKEQMLLVVSYLDMMGVDSGICNVVTHLCGGTE